jgi:polysaccharide pyruvyl transferase WcaK-like protein
MVMKLLVDHGVYQNVGDVSMLEAVVARCQQKHPLAHLYVVQGDFQSSVWQSDRIVPQAPYQVRPWFKKIIWFFMKKQNYVLDKFLTAIFTNIYCRTVGSTIIYVENKKYRINEFCDRFDGYLITGGGNLNDIFYKNLFEKLVLIKGFLQQNKPVILTGQQLGPIKSLFFRNAAMRMFRNVSFIGLRDPGNSAEFCMHAGIPRDRFRVMGDDSLNLLPAKPSIVRDCLQRNGLVAGKFIAVNLRIVWYAITMRKLLPNLICVLKELSDTLCMPLVFVPISWAEHDSDYKAAKLLKSELDSIQILHLLQPFPALVKAVLGHAFGSIGTSFHFCTFSLCQGVPAFCVYQSEYYAQKAKSLELFWQETGLSCDIQNLTTASAGHIMKYWSDTLVRDRLSKKSENATFVWQQVFDAQMQKLFGMDDTFLGDGFRPQIPDWKEIEF